MPKNEIKISRYEGMVGNADERDLPDGLAIYARNLDMAQATGLFVPLKEDNITASTNIAGYRFEKFSTASGDEIAAFRNPSDNTIRYATSLNADPPSDTSTGKTRFITDGNGAIVSDGQAVHMGFGGTSNANYRPLWVGYVGHEQLGVTDPSSSSPAWPEENIGIVADSTEIRSDVIYTSDAASPTPTDDWQITLPAEGEDSDNSGRRYDPDDVIFPMGIRYAYYASLVYDGFQEAPLRYLGSIKLTKSEVLIQMTSGRTTEPSLILGALGSNAGTSHAYAETGSTDWKIATHAIQGETEQPITGASKFGFYIWVRTKDDTGLGYAELNRRVTGMHIYRAEQVKGTAQMGPPKHIKYYSINDEDWTTGFGAADDRGELYTGDNELPAGYYYYVFFEDDIEAAQDTFEDRTGYSSAIEDMRIYWGLSATIDGWHFIGRCYHSQLLETQSWLFRSKKWRFNTFDWTKDYLVLPTAPSAMVGYQSRIYCFADGRTYLVNPGTFDIEETIEGIGCTDDRSVVVSDRGMFWAGTKNIYYHDGSRINTIGTPILQNAYNEDVGFDSRDTTQTPICCFSSSFDSFIVWFKGGDSNYYGYMYHIPSSRWTLLSLSGSVTSINGVLYRTNGQPMLSVTTGAGDNLYELFKDSSDRAWEWVGYNKPTIGRKAVFYKARVSHRGSTPDVYYYPDDLAYASNSGNGHAWSSTAADGSHVTEGVINQKGGGSWNYVRDMAIRVVGNVTGEDATDISLIIREITPR